LLGDDVVELLSKQIEEQPVDMDQRRDALSECIGKLRESDQELLRRRYAGAVTGDEVAHQLGRPANSVYQSLGRVRKALIECVRRRMATGGAQ
jgi:RNA polymerase sigma-70 factor (ECF subfamily)